MNGEVLTLQFGHYSNFVGSHWWNIQENSFEYSNLQSNAQGIKHDVLFREGLNDKGQVTFTPRLLLVDLKGSLGALPESSSLYNEVSTNPKDVNVEWNPNKIEIQSKTCTKNKFQQDLDNGKKLNEIDYELDNLVDVWSDFLYTRFHPRTINIVKDYSHNESLFDTFPSGQALWKTESFSDDFCDKIRNYVEECDYFQGFQVLLDSFNGFSGLSSSCIEYLKDEYSKTTLCYPLIPSFYNDYNYQTDEEKHQSIIKDSTRVLNFGFLFNALRENSSLFIPLSTSENGWRQPGEKREFYHTKYNSKSHYHTSAILASALDTYTLKFRLKNCSNYTLQDLSSDLASFNRKAACGSLCLPFSLNSDCEFIECLDNWDGDLTKSITPRCRIDSDHMVQLYTLRGVPENRLKKSGGAQMNLPAYKCKTLKEMLEFYLECNTFSTLNNVTTVNEPLMVKVPYPKIFDDSVGPNGNILANSCVDQNVQSVPVLAGLHNGKGVGEMLETLHTEMKKIKFGKFHSFINEGVEMDDFVECLDNLFDFRECYELNYNL